jgi:hypothetical protein
LPLNEGFKVKERRREERERTRKAALYIQGIAACVRTLN